MRHSKYALQRRPFLVDVYLLCSQGRVEAELCPGRETLVLGHLGVTDGEIPCLSYYIFSHLWRRIR